MAPMSLLSRAAAAFLFGMPAFAADWPMWGGDPSRNMVNEVERGIPSTWDLKTRENVRWVAALGTQTYGGVVVARGKVLVGTNNGAPRDPTVQGDKGILLCLRESDGQLLWQSVHDKLESGRANDWPEVGICSTPAVDGDRLYYVSNRAELVCADLEGFLDGENDGPYDLERRRERNDPDLVWVLDMVGKLGVYPHNQATSSPLVVGDAVYVVTSNGVSDEDHVTIPAPKAPSFLAASKRTGEILWTSSVPGPGILHGQWSSPAYMEVGGKGLVIVPGGDGWIRALDAAKGSTIWEFDCNLPDSKWKEDGTGTRNYPVATPVCAGGKVFIGIGDDPEHGDGPGSLVAIDAGGTGDITRSGCAWRRGGEDFRRTLSSVAVKDGLVYAADMTGFVYCLDERTGELCWKDDLLATVWGSPTWIDGKVYIGDEDGDITVYRPGRRLEKIAEVNVGTSVYSTPVAAGGVLYVGTRNQLIAVGGRETPAAGPEGALPASPRQGDSSAAAGKSAVPVAAPVPAADPAGPVPAAGSSPGATTGDAWPSFRGDHLLTGSSGARVSDSPKLLWTFDAKTGIESTAAIVGERVYVGMADGGLLALRLETGNKDGEELWRAKTDSGIRSSPLVMGGRVYFGDDGGVVHAVDAASGAPAWTFDTGTGSEIISSANSDGERILIGSYDGFLYCLAAGTGRLLWKYETQGPVNATPALAGGRAFVAGCDGQLRAVDIIEGREVSATDMEAQSGASPSIVGDRLFVGTLGTEVLCFDWKANRRVWSYEGAERQSPFYSSSAVAPMAADPLGVVVIGGRDKLVHAIRASDGRGVWTFPTKAAVDASPVIAGGRVIVPGLDGTLYLLDLATGKEVWRYTAGSKFSASPALARGRLVVAGEDGLVYCFDVKP